MGGYGSDEFGYPLTAMEALLRDRRTNVLPLPIKQPDDDQDNQENEDNGTE